MKIPAVALFCGMMLSMCWLACWLASKKLFIVDVIAAILTLLLIVWLLLSLWR